MSNEGGRVAVGGACRCRCPGSLRAVSGGATATRATSASEAAGVGADVCDLTVRGAGQIGHVSTISLTAVIAVQTHG